jgi:hypothetical protein
MNKTTLNFQPSSQRSSKIGEHKPFYRGFSSIDQEMAREIAMQWFSTSAKKPIKFHGYTLSSKKRV